MIGQCGFMIVIRVCDSCKYQKPIYYKLISSEGNVLMKLCEKCGLARVNTDGELEKKD